MSILEKEFTILGILKAKREDNMGYINYVFECLDDNIRMYTPYILCTRYPDWCHAPVNIGDKGYLTVHEIEAGEHKWFDGEKLIPYKYDTIQFIKFIPTEEKENEIYKM